MTPVSPATREAIIEAIYERLAEGIDQAGADGESLFLARLCLLLGAELGDAARFTDAVTAALGPRVY